MSQHDSESKYWVANHFLSCLTRGTFRPPANAYAYNLLRRAEGAFQEHEEARRATLAFLTSGGQSGSLYTGAVLHWEFFLSQSWQGYMLLKKLLELMGGEEFKLFTRGDGSIEERLNSLYNSMKHVESRIAAGQILEGATIPVWLTNDGIQSTDVIITYAETGEILENIAEWADIVVDPTETANKLRTVGTDS